MTPAKFYGRGGVVREKSGRKGEKVAKSSPRDRPSSATTLGETMELEKVQNMVG
jgi:hypothetical protein